MIGFVDIGNTRLKWGLADATGWQARGHADRHDLDAWAAVLRAWPSVSAIWAVSVAGVAAEAALADALGTRAAQLRWLRSGAASQAGVVNGYRQPAQLGADRWAALIGAWARVRGPALVVVAGTATTVDVLDRRDGQGFFAGGAIAPGVSMMRAALAGGTAQLPAASGEPVKLPVTTDEAIVTGCIEAQAGLVERMRRRLPAGAPVVLSGGAAPALVSHIAAPCLEIDDLVLEGLRAAALY